MVEHLKKLEKMFTFEIIIIFGILLINCAPSKAFTAPLKYASISPSLLQSTKPNQIQSSKPGCAELIPIGNRRGGISCLRNTANPYVTSFIHDPNFDETEEEKEEEITPKLGAWIPVGSASAFSGITPVKIEIMGMDYVVWKSVSSRSDSNKKKEQKTARKSQQKKDTTEWSVMLDVCPHHLAPLSQGRVDPQTGCVECPYHGWQFMPNGTVACIPQLDATCSLESIETKASAKALPVHVTGDLIWAFIPSSVHGESFPVDLLPEKYYSGIMDDMARGATYYSHEMPCSMDILVENGLDPAHFPFAHHGIISKRSDVSPMPMQVVTSNFTHLDLGISYVRNGEPRDRLYSFQRPVLLCTQERSEGGWKQASKFFIVPVREGRSRILTSVAKLSKKSIPDWITHMLTSRLFKGDLFLHETERVRQSGGTYFNPPSYDEGTKAWQKWHSKYKMIKAPAHTFGSASIVNRERLSRCEQEDQWRCHTSICSKCRATLRRAKKVQVWSCMGGMAGALFLQRTNPVLAALVGGGGLVVSLLAKKLAIFHEGGIHQSDYRDRSVSMEMK